ncbi:hypothetical protein IQ251_04005 [Saccharopolyspora sp. HNM0983]|uniref:Sugar lactone lactonase YvrE n=1 Tax=Saccharopolyspora montiporae TaxID=2781240 RepID=A0A929B9G7_9PSEU|nr:hypothetical protein [Saccharopolyspora sp. HNM0983]MBE9373608.1 hypothetical protein [Saccharopolyspora sp. HNM0983]
MTTSRFHTPGQGQPSSPRWNLRRLNDTNPLWGSNGTAFGPDGRLYVAQFLAGQISAVDIATGDVEIVVPLDSPVQTPDDLAFAGDGTMYIADIAPSRVWRRSTAGEYALLTETVRQPNGITCVGDRLFVNEMRPGGRLFEVFPDGSEPKLLTGGLALGNAMQLGPDGKLYYPHMMDRQVWRIPPEGGQPELVAEDLDAPVAVRFDRGGELRVLSCGPHGVITRIDQDSGERSLIRTGLAGLDNAAFDAENRMYVSSFAHGGITEVHEDGRTRDIVRRGMNGPFGVTADRSGTVFATDHFSLVSTGDSGEVTPVDVATASLPTYVRTVAADGDVLQLTTARGEVYTYDPRQKSSRVRARGLGEPAGIAVAPDGRVVVAVPGSGQVLAFDEDDAVTVLAEDLPAPVGVAVTADGTCYTTDERLGSLLRLDADGPVAVCDGLLAPQGLAATGGALYVVETGRRRLLRVHPQDGAVEVEAEELAVGLPPGIERDEPVVTDGFIGRPRSFADLSAGPDGGLLVAANGEGSVLRLEPRGTA